MTFAEAIDAVRAGKVVTHPRANTGWRLRLEGKSAVWTNPKLPYITAVDKFDQHRKDWFGI
jgi:hypothetical protein